MAAPSGVPCGDENLLAVGECVPGECDEVGEVTVLVTVGEKGDLVMDAVVLTLERVGVHERVLENDTGTCELDTVYTGVFDPEKETTGAERGTEGVGVQLEVMELVASVADGVGDTAGVLVMSVADGVNDTAGVLVMSVGDGVDVTAPPGCEAVGVLVTSLAVGVAVMDTDAPRDAAADGDALV